MNLAIGLGFGYSSGSMRILAIKLRAIGDTVIWTSALKALHKAYPDAEIHVLTYAANAPVLSNLEFIDKIHVLRSKGYFSLLLKLLSFRREKFDWVLCFHANTSLARAAWVAGGRRLAIHHHSRQRTPPSSVPIPEPGKLEDAISRDYQILKAMGLDVAHESTQIQINSEEAERAETVMREAIAAVEGDSAKPRFMFLPGASHHLRRYPRELWWPEVLKVRDRRVHQPVVLCDSALAKEWDLKHQCRKENIPLIDMGGLREFMAYVAKGERALANDSGPGHIAVALGVKTSFVFGPGCVGDWHCYDRSEHPIYRVPVSCRASGPRDQEAFQFCTLKSCDHHTCMRDVRLSL